MEQIGIFDAKTRFSEIVKRVKDSARPIRITNRGEQMVDIVPVSNAVGRRRSSAEAFNQLASLRLKLPKTTLAQIRADIAEGRR